MEINGNTAYVTGGASGLGAATVRLLAQAGARVAILDLNEELAQAVAREVGGVAVRVDVAKEDSVAAAVAAARAALGPARILVNAAGIGIGRRIVNKDGPHPMADFRRVVDVNLTGTFDMCRLVAADMIKLDTVNGEERGVIVNVASIFAFDGPIGDTAYAAAKAGVTGMTLPMARDLAQHGIRVVTIAPGIFDTPLARAEVGGQLDQMITHVPFPHRPGKPAEFAAMVRSICENPMLNGETIRLDGAFRMGLRI